MKKIFTLLFLAFCAGLSAQSIPNSSFENWQPYSTTYTTQVPQHWWTFDVLYAAFNPTASPTSVSKTMQSHSGNYAVLLKTEVINNDTIQPALFSNDSLGLSGSPMGFSYTQRPLNFTGYYKLAATGGDSLEFDVGMTKWSGNHRDTIAKRFFKLATPASVYTPFSFQMSYLSGSNPDTVFIGIGLAGPHGTNPHPGSQAYVDDLAFSGSVPLGIKEIGADNNVVSVSPNPISTSAQIKLDRSLDLKGLQLFIYDALGREVRHIDQFHSYTTEINREGLKNGVYFYRLFSDQVPASCGKLILEN